MILLLQCLLYSIFALPLQGFSLEISDNQQYFELQKNLKIELHYFDVEQKSFLPLNSSQVNAVYLNINLLDYHNRFFSIRTNKGTSLFINNQYASTLETDNNLFSIDSLKLHWPEGQVQLALYHADLNLDKLEIGIMKRVIVQHNDAYTSLVIRENNFEKDFLIIALIIILIAFALLVSTNPKLTSEYLNIIRVISIRDREETILNARLSSPINLTYYAFCATAAALFFIMVINANPSNFELSAYTQSQTLGMAMLKWGMFSIILFGLMIAKVLVLYSLTVVFNMRPFLPLHHFNFIRLSIMVFGLGLILTAGFFLSGLNSSGLYSGLLLLLTWVFGLWIIILLLKLISRAEFRISHLFSYICGSEVIPFLVIIKILYF